MVDKIDFSERIEQVKTKIENQRNQAKRSLEAADRLRQEKELQHIAQESVAEEETKKAYALSNRFIDWVRVHGIAPDVVLTQKQHTRRMILFAEVEEIATHQLWQIGEGTPVRVRENTETYGLYNQDPAFVEHEIAPKFWCGLSLSDEVALFGNSVSYHGGASAPEVFKGDLLNVGFGEMILNRVAELAVVTGADTAQF